VTRVVLDTNVLVSALLFSGTASRLVTLWQSHRIVPLVSRPILEEYFRVLAYPKFRLSTAEVRGLVEEQVLPFVETVRIRRRLAVVRLDPDDDKFIECAAAGHAQYVVTGDSALLDVREYRGVQIVAVRDLLRMFTQ
jgi:putative PIN family toxin of toxin-antitoxin system